MIIQLKKGTWVLLGMIAACLVVIIATSLYCTFPFGASRKDQKEDGPPLDEYPAEDAIEPLPPSSAQMGVYTRGAIVSNSPPCAAIGNKILSKYGSAVDAAIATLICDGVGCLQNMGLGGGFLMTYYSKSEGKAYALNARETAPAASTMNMFRDNPRSSQLGGLSVGVPGELRGYHAAYKRFGGKAPWAELFKDTIDLCRSGIPVNDHLYKSITSYEKAIRSSVGLSEMLLKENGSLPQVGDKLRLPKLASTFQLIADYGPDVLYNGSLTQGFVDDIRAAGGIITVDDMANYTARWEEPISVNLSGGLRLFSSPPPGSGAILAHILLVLDGFLHTGDQVTDTQRITEAFKFAYAHRTRLGDPHYANVSQLVDSLSSEEFAKAIRGRIQDNSTHQDSSWYGAQFSLVEDHGTANMAVISPDGDAVTATSTINLVFGSKVVSRSTGIILNNEMDDFSSTDVGANYFGVEASPENSIAPGKRPMSSMCPTIVVDAKTGRVRLAVGAAGGTKITTATALVSIWNLWYNKTLKEAIDEPRFHHQLTPMKWQYEYGILKSMIQRMMELGHVTERYSFNWRSAITALASNRTHLMAFADSRRSGQADGLL